jgi:hypothetical protein
MAGKMVEVEGFKAFRGVMMVQILYDAENDDILTDVPVFGEWLYRPDTNCWYSKGASYPAEFCSVMEVIW